MFGGSAESAADKPPAYRLLDCLTAACNEEDAMYALQRLLTRERARAMLEAERDEGRSTGLLTEAARIVVEKMEGEMGPRLIQEGLDMSDRDMVRLRSLLSFDIVDGKRVRKELLPGVDWPALAGTYATKAERDRHLRGTSRARAPTAAAPT